jgi:hypothetical protein
MSSGSQKRKTTAQIKVNCTPAQKAAILEKADQTGLSPAAICLAVLVDVPLPKRRRPSSNVNQIAYMLNANTAPERIMNLIETGLQEHRDAQAKHQDILDDLHELRTMAMEALGYED